MFSGFGVANLCDGPRVEVDDDDTAVVVVVVWDVDMDLREGFLWLDSDD